MCVACDVAVIPKFLDVVDKLDIAQVGVAGAEKVPVPGLVVVVYVNLVVVVAALQETEEFPGQLVRLD